MDPSKYAYYPGSLPSPYVPPPGHPPSNYRPPGHPPQNYPPPPPGDFPPNYRLQGHIPPNYPPPPPYYPVQPPCNPAMSVVPPPRPPAPVNKNYKITVRGRLQPFASQFAIDVVSNGRILLHVNPRFSLFDKTTVFNSYTASGGWGAEERRRFDTLKQGKSFVITIQSRGDFFYIDVNGEKYTYQKRILEGPTREVKISKVEDEDVNITAIEITSI